MTFVEQGHTEKEAVFTVMQKLYTYMEVENANMDGDWCATLMKRNPFNVSHNGPVRYFTYSADSDELEEN